MTRKYEKFGKTGRKSDKVITVSGIQFQLWHNGGKEYDLRSGRFYKAPNRATIDVTFSENGWQDCQAAGFNDKDSIKRAVKFAARHCGSVKGLTARLEKWLATGK